MVRENTPCAVSWGAIQNCPLEIPANEKVPSFPAGLKAQFLSGLGIPTMKRILTLVLLGGCAVAGGTLVTLLSSRFIASALAQPQTGAVPSEVDRLGERFERVARKVSPAVVAVEAVKPPSSATNGKTKPVEESGSGFLIRAMGVREALVLTNN